MISAPFYRYLMILGPMARPLIFAASILFMVMSDAVIADAAQRWRPQDPLAYDAPPTEEKLQKGHVEKKKNPKPEQTFQPPEEMSLKEMRRVLLRWMTERGIDEKKRLDILARWETQLEGDPGDETRLRETLHTAARISEHIPRFLAACDELIWDPPSMGAAELPEFETLREDELPPSVESHLKLYLAWRLVQANLYDEAWDLLENRPTEPCLAPSILLFCRAVAAHRLLLEKESLEALDVLNSGETEASRRHQELARLMEEDLKRLKKDSPEHISRRMEDIERRLGFGRTGEKVQEVEKGVIDSLDKLIQQIEDQVQQQQQQQQQQSMPSKNAQSQPAESSRILRGKGPGRVDKRDIGSGSGWGDLPPKEREKTLQQINRQFPSHYRTIIEQYFRKMAAEEE